MSLKCRYKSTKVLASLMMTLQRFSIFWHIINKIIKCVTLSAPKCVCKLNNIINFECIYILASSLWIELRNKYVPKCLPSFINKHFFDHFQLTWCIYFINSLSTKGINYNISLWAILQNVQTYIYYLPQWRWWRCLVPEELCCWIFVFKRRKTEKNKQWTSWQLGSWDKLKGARTECVIGWQFEKKKKKQISSNEYNK